MNIKQIKKQLETELREAEKRRQQLAEQLDERPEFGLGTGSTGSYTWEMALARRDRVAEEIQTLQAALKRVNDGSYGQCENCGKPIDPERLEILPTTTLCSDCARTGQASVTSRSKTNSQVMVGR
jgi:RNA polymerase-binding transcription factor DksA